MEQFASCVPTVKFVRLIDRLFDILSWQSPVACGFKESLCLATQERWKAVLKSTAEYLLWLKTSNGQILRLHRRKTSVIRFVLTIKSMIMLANRLLQCPLCCVVAQATRMNSVKHTKHVRPCRINSIQQTTTGSRQLSIIKRLPCEAAHHNEAITIVNNTTSLLLFKFLQPQWFLYLSPTSCYCNWNPCWSHWFCLL